jgi:hypothetical protein
MNPLRLCAFPSPPRSIAGFNHSTRSHIFRIHYSFNFTKTFPCCLLSVILQKSLWYMGTNDICSLVKYSGNISYRDTPNPY